MATEIATETATGTATLQASIVTLTTTAILPTTSDSADDRTGTLTTATRPDPTTRIDTHRATAILLTDTLTTDTPLE